MERNKADLNIVQDRDIWEKGGNKKGEPPGRTDVYKRLTDAETAIL